MKQCTAAFKAHLAQPYQTIATCCLRIKKNGTVLAETDHDQDLTYNLESYLTSASIHIPSLIVGSGAQVYRGSGYTATDIATGSDLAVDNVEVSAPTILPSVTEATLQQGAWDFAFYIIFWVNWKDLSNTMGALILRCGNVGQIVLERGLSRVELHGLTKAYTRNIGELTSESCRANLGDARCKVNLVPFTFTGTLEDVSADGFTLYDSARTEPGPAGGVVITGVSNANPAHVTTATDLGLPVGAAVTISEVLGMTQVNAVTSIRNPTAGGFDLSIDTSNTGAYPPYTGGGLVTPMGAESGFFDFGTFTPTSGPNFDAGLWMDIKSYVPGQWTLMLPFPFALVPGDTYIIVAGCDKSFFTCKNKFANVSNKRSEDYLPGMDRYVQIGKSGA